MALPKIAIDRIEADAKKAAMITEYGEYDGGPSNSARMQLTSRVDPIHKEFYIKGATAEAERAETIRLQLEAQDANVEILLQQKKELKEKAQKLVDFIQEIIDFPPAMSKSAMSEWIDKYREEGRQLIQLWNAGKENQYEGSVITEPVPGIALGCISPEARELLDTIVEQWEVHYNNMKEMHGDAMPETTFYGFAYWLVRWSGLIRPMPKNKPMPDGCPYCGSPECTSDHK